jgi:hypothetical protein
MHGCGRHREQDFGPLAVIMQANQISNEAMETK